MSLCLRCMVLDLCFLSHFSFVLNFTYYIYFSLHTIVFYVLYYINIDLDYCCKAITVSQCSR